MDSPAPARVALCLVGQFRDHFSSSAGSSVYSGLKTLTSHPPAGWEVDVFVDTWIESGLGRKHEKNVLVSSPESEATAMDPNWLTSYPNLAGLRLERTPASVSTLLRGVSIPPALQELAPEHFSGTLPHLWKMRSCREQWMAWAGDQQFSYDAVIKMRPDSLFFSSSLLSHMMGAVEAIVAERHLPDQDRTHLFTSSERIAGAQMVSDKYAVGTPTGMRFYMNLWEEAPALWKEWESRPNASRGAVPVGERLMHWHMEKASFHHVRAFPGETTRRELRQRKLTKSPQITLQAEETQGTAAPASAGQIEPPSKREEFAQSLAVRLEEHARTSDNTSVPDNTSAPANTSASDNTSAPLPAQAAPSLSSAAPAPAPAATAPVPAVPALSLASAVPSPSQAVPSLAPASPSPAAPSLAPAVPVPAPAAPSPSPAVQSLAQKADPPSDTAHLSTALGIRLPERSGTALTDEQRTDPRLSAACSGFHGSWASAMLPDFSPASSLIVRTVEDVVANRSMPSDRVLRKQFGTCDMPYGRYGQRGTFYLEIPKTGSTTMKARFQSGGRMHELPSKFPQGVKNSFAFVREPLTRMLSGYGTLVKRLRSRLRKKLWPAFLYEADESKRFEGFVNMLTSRTDRDLASKDNNIDCVWQHVMTQMWFFNLYRAKVTYLARLEDLDTELHAIRLRLNVTFGDKGNSNKNEGELDGVDVQSLSRTVPHAVEKLLKHLRQDYECLQYPMPSIRALAAGA